MLTAELPRLPLILDDVPASLTQMQDRIARREAMIAFIHEPEKPPTLPAVRRVRRLLASTLLAGNSTASGSAPPTTAWRAWLFTAWVTAVAVWCVAHVVRCLW